MDDPASEEAYELVLGVSKGIRSLMSEYSLKDEAEGKQKSPIPKVSRY
jgi:valyl-tRNA synthetase